MNYEIKGSTLSLVNDSNQSFNVNLENCIGFISENLHLRVSISEYILGQNGVRSKKSHVITFKSRDEFDQITGKFSKRPYM